MPMPINIAPSSRVRPTGNRSDGGACIAVVFARCGIFPAMRRVWLLLWALWLALAPIGSAWAYACACTGQPALACCVRLNPCCKTSPAAQGESCAAGENGLPPSFRFPPLREGNRDGAEVSPLREGNHNRTEVSPLREGNCGGAQVRFPLPAGGTLRRGLDSEATPLREGNLSEGVTKKHPCSEGNCQGCTLKQAKPALAAASVNRPALEWADVVLDAPALEGLTRVEPLRACFGLPAVRNHSPPREPSAPRAPPLCCVC
jgi:hypothetical protein